MAPDVHTHTQPLVRALLVPCPSQKSAACPMHMQDPAWLEEYLHWKVQRFYHTSLHTIDCQNAVTEVRSPCPFWHALCHCAPACVWLDLM